MEKVFGGLGIRYLQAHFKCSPPTYPIEKTVTFAHILNNVGFDHPGELFSLVAAWRNLFELVEPDLVICDHSPTALLALRGLPAKRATIGAGFSCPIAIAPFPVLEPRLPHTPEELLADEARLLANANEVLDRFGSPPLEYLAQLYADLDDRILITFQEMDHYQDRAGATYWGLSPLVPGAPPAWPHGDRRRVFGYLKPFASLPTLLELLNRLELPTVIHPDGISTSIQQKYASRTLHFQQERVDITQARRDCHFAILNANHATLAAFILGGKPVLNFPLSLEQEMCAAPIVERGAGLVVSGTEPNDIFRKMEMILGSDEYTAGAERIAEKYRDWDYEASGIRLAEHMESLIART
ncbi:hypothetical protein Pan216_18980 [Planctomycetes bacterium Pan216]|uniref:Uncharacterized protein n=1 Tax=Kolteria novifilia TaxID=2527975 RepID=A0A518B234_9BACT|nr:hypothetical protein Pan216_18980 [Planctomycetes bacterium Pan216]